MATTEHRSPEGHEICDGVVAIADEFVEVIRDEGLESHVSLASFTRSSYAVFSKYSKRLKMGITLALTYRSFRVIQPNASRKPPLSKQAQLRNDELVELSNFPECKQQLSRWLNSKHTIHWGAYLLGRKIHCSVFSSSPSSNSNSSRKLSNPQKKNPRSDIANKVTMGNKHPFCRQGRQNNLQGDEIKS